MPRRELLTPTERVQLFAFPEDESELIRLATLARTDLTYIRQHRGDHNRLGLAGVTSRKGFFSTLRLDGWSFPLPKRPEPSLGDAFVGMPVVVPGQMDVVPGQRG